jgi:uncharacterized protein YjbJ (UPF0337 family)
MNWNEVEGKWNQVKGSIREKYGKLTDDDLQVIGGKKDKFIGKLQERYGMQQEQAERDADAWLKGVRLTDTPRTHTSGGSGSH